MAASRPHGACSACLRPLHLAVLAVAASAAVALWGARSCDAATQPARSGMGDGIFRTMDTISAPPLQGAMQAASKARTTSQSLLRGGGSERPGGSSRRQAAAQAPRRRNLKDVGDTTFTYQWFGLGQKQAQVQGSKTAAQGLTATVTAGRPPGVGIQGIVERGGLLVPVNRGPTGATPSTGGAAAGGGGTSGGTGTTPARGITGIRGRQSSAAASGAGPVGIVNAGSVAAQPQYGYPDYFQYAGLYGLDYYQGAGGAGLLGGALEYSNYGGGGGLG